jgi:hypothetical protein
MMIATMFGIGGLGQAWSYVQSLQKYQQSTADSSSNEQNDADNFPSFREVFGENISREKGPDSTPKLDPAEHGFVMQQKFLTLAEVNAPPDTRLCSTESNPKHNYAPLEKLDKLIENKTISSRLSTLSGLPIRRPQNTLVPSSETLRLPKFSSDPPRRDFSSDSNSNHEDRREHKEQPIGPVLISRASPLRPSGTFRPSPSLEPQALGKLPSSFYLSLAYIQFW